MTQTLPREPLMQVQRMGVHYFPDTLHYREVDLANWLPVLQQLGVSWIVLEAETERAIPETFLQGLIQANITPILRFRPSLSLPIAPDQVRLLLETYAHWGIKWVVFYDRPNIRSSWPASGWVQHDLVERFLDRLVPLANAALDAGLTPILPPLEPGGHYWDSAFLWTLFQSLVRRKQQRLIDQMAIGALAWTSHHSLNWGAGGPERWPEVRPYFTPPCDQDQRGFRIDEWYQAIAQAVLQKRVPVFLFQAGIPVNPEAKPAIDRKHQSEICAQIMRLLLGELSIDPMQPGDILNPISEEVVACNFWQLTSESEEKGAWFSNPEQPYPAGAEVLRQVKDFRRRGCARPAAQPASGGEERVLQRYILLPTYEWGMADWHWNIIQPYVSKYRPTVGFSLQEAALATEVMVVGGEDSFSVEDLNWLRQAGVQVERITGDGPTIATQLSVR